jgi:hypothetical protein
MDDPPFVEDIDEDADDNEWEDVPDAEMPALPANGDSDSDDAVEPPPRAMAVGRRIALPPLPAPAPAMLAIQPRNNMRRARRDDAAAAAAAANEEVTISLLIYNNK